MLKSALGFMPGVRQFSLCDAEVDQVRDMSLLSVCYSHMQDLHECYRTSPCLLRQLHLE